MDLQPSFEYLCRVCAVNTKGKHSVAECVYILKTPGLQEKIERHLYLTLNKDDVFPKVLCKTCFRQVEATASLSNIAKHTQQVFRDFLINTLPKYKNTSVQNISAINSNPQHQQHQHYHNNNNNNNSSNSNSVVRHFNNRNSDEFRPLVLTKAPETTITLAPPAAPAAVAATTQINRDEVSISLTKRNNESRPRTKNTAIQRRNSIFDMRQFNAPVSIAQRALLPPSIAPPSVEITTAPAKSSNNNKNCSSNSSSSSSNSQATSIKSTIKQTKLTTISGTSTVINFIHTQNNTQSQPTTTTQSNGTRSMPSSVIQQKRHNLRMTLNNIKALNSGGQVSLLKSSQPKATENVAKLPITSNTATSTAANCNSSSSSNSGGNNSNNSNASSSGNNNKANTINKLNKTLLAEPSAEECLPENIIIAAPKKKRDFTSAPPVPPLVLCKEPRSLNKSQAKPSKPNINPVASLTEGILLGSVIRDPDLLKLILKALKWPVNNSNFDDQMTRLKNSKFADIMSDSNLLQDTDLTQLLGPYITPVLLAAQVLQQKSQSTKASSSSNSSSTATSSKQNSDKQKSLELPKQKTGTKLADIQNTADLASAIPYKLPPETSVQLVPSSPTDTDAATTKSKNPFADAQLTKSTLTTCHPPRKMRARESSLVISPEDLGVNDKTNLSQLNLNALLIAQYAQGLNVSDPNLALYALLQKQQAAIAVNSSHQRSRRHRSTSPRSTTASINLEDIVLIEPQPTMDENVETTSATTATKTNQASNKKNEKSFGPLHFKLPSLQEPPIITRPIIKRRKTVIQSSKTTHADSSAESKHIKQTEAKLTSQKTEESKVAEKPVTNVAKPVEAEKQKAEKIETPQVPTSTVHETASITTTQTTPTSTSSVTVAATPAAIAAVDATDDVVVDADKSVISNVDATLAVEATTTAESTPKLKKEETKKTTPMTEMIATATTTTKPPVIKPTATLTTSTTSTTTTTPPMTKPTTSITKKSSNSKAALGQQLLQAIGLKQVGDDGSVDGKIFAETSRDTLRSALKRSLKQAQEQQMKRIKQEEPVKQMADSTTKSSARESVDEMQEQKPIDIKEQLRRNRRVETSKSIKLEEDEDDDDKTRVIKDEKTEQPNVSSSDSAPRKRGRKRKEVREAELRKAEEESLAGDDKFSERWDDDDELPLRQDAAPSRQSSRPARTSKTLSKYYKGPEKVCNKSHNMGTRATRSRT